MRATATATPFLRVRSGPGTTYREIAQLPTGSAVTIAERDHAGTPWVYVTPPGGWVHGDYLSEAELPIETDVIHKGANNRPGDKLKPLCITVHNTANASPGADARMHARYLKGQDARRRKVSWHYTVDDERIVQHLPDEEVGWHAGPGNRQSIGVEVCEHQGIDEDKAVDLAARLVALLCQRHGIKPDAAGIRTHKAWTGKDCPHVILRRPGGFGAFIQHVQRYA